MFLLWSLYSYPISRYKYPHANDAACMTPSEDDTLTYRILTYEAFLAKLPKPSFFTTSWVLPVWLLNPHRVHIPLLLKGCFVCRTIPSHVAILLSAGCFSTGVWPTFMYMICMLVTTFIHWLSLEHTHKPLAVSCVGLQPGCRITAWVNLAEGWTSSVRTCPGFLSCPAQFSVQDTQVNSM